MSSTDEFNARTIAEFRGHHGKVAHVFERFPSLQQWIQSGAPLLLLHTIGARSGQPRINPLMYLKDGERYVVFASKSGADANPDWYWNLRAHPDAQTEVEDETIDVHAEEALGPERERFFVRQTAVYSELADFQRKTTRTIPVIMLTQKKNLRH